MQRPSLQLWVIEPNEDSLGVYCDSHDLLRSIVNTGVAPKPARAAIEDSAQVKPPSFFFVNKKGKLFKGAVPAPPDLSFWGWIPVFSDRAYEIAIAVGVSAADFLHCQFEQVPTRKYYLHLPGQSFPVVDFGASEFMMWLPADPPIPHRIEKAKLLSVEDAVAPCFRVGIPGYPHVLSDLFAAKAFVQAWQGSGARGASFRLVTQNDA
jgi:hypothetical protein